MKHFQLVPNLITLANAFCGLLALAKAIDALALSGDDPLVFYRKMETACSLIFLGMVFDSLDGFVARLTGAYSDFGAQLDSFSDALTFGIAPAMLAKVLVEHEVDVTGWSGDARLHFIAAAAFALMAILRLVRFNLETEHEEESHSQFRGLPSPAAAGAVASTIWLYLILRAPELETVDGTPTPLRRLLGWMQDVNWSPWIDLVPAFLVALLPVLGFLMVSNVRYLHPVVFMASNRTQLLTLVAVLYGAFLTFLAPVPIAFAVFNGYVLFGLVRTVLRRRSEHAAEPAGGGGSSPEPGPEEARE